MPDWADAAAAEIRMYLLSDSSAGEVAEIIRRHAENHAPADQKSLPSYQCVCGSTNTGDAGAASYLDTVCKECNRTWKRDDVRYRLAAKPYAPADIIEALRELYKCKPYSQLISELNRWGAAMDKAQAMLRKYDPEGR